MKVIEILKRFWRDEEGLEMVEWALIGGFVAVIIVVAWGTIGNSVENVMGGIGGVLDSQSANLANAVE